MTRYLSLAVFCALVLGGGSLIGYANQPGAWFAGLAKPAFNPPGWLFAPVWSALYLMIAVAGWRIWEKHRTSAAMRLWGAALVLNFLWSPVFFGLQNPGAAFAVILVLLALIYGFIAKAWRLDRVSAGLFVPYAAWVSFATVLNGAIWRLN